MKLFLLILSVFVALANCTRSEFAPIVQLKDGQVRGIVQQVESGGKVYLYEGIRYGRANRFEKLTPVEPWSGVYNATKWRDSCPPASNNSPNCTQSISEDCLFVNVWRPVEKSTANRTVMVWIYGGGYIGGTIFAKIYDGRYLTQQGDVVLVAIHYRLGPFGFLYGGTRDAPGNLGLHDQILALKWVRDNIHHFGGDGHKVTIFGESAGSFSVGSLVLSPLAKDLFHRAILQSGSPNSYYGIMSHAESFKVARSIAHNVSCANVDQIRDIIQCLRNKTVQEIVNAAQNLWSIEHRKFKPIYEDELLPVRPVKALQRSKFNHDIDLMYGVTSHEGSGFPIVQDKVRDKNLTVQSAKEAIEQIATVFNQSRFSEEIGQFYTFKLHNNSTQDQLKIAVRDSFGDLILTCPTIFYAEQYAKLNSNRHFYSYRLVKPTHLHNCTGWMSVCHAEDLAYLFPPEQIRTAPELAQLSRDMIKAWTTFAKTGRPGMMGNVEWTEALDANRDTVTKHMSLDAADYKMVPQFYKETCNIFWKPKIFV